MGERMAKVETKVNYIAEEIVEIKDLIRAHMKKEDERHAHLKDKFASKWVEKVVAGLVTLILTGFTIAIISLVVK